ncbi:MAG: 50S ribosomal protein L6 [Candidatus Spechtbacteria bacterium RIFCSPLOWO2_01_FULL_46_10]|uniref:Large ribosomal subunit protein uL6 n=1 Tax=Candidatus Spechtbacteria bacterium RIFCSPLOWO2_01_FULL_46_10 TaxID=1802163 RepID=A0A1G2HG45_9BACT|nr:MAG: 50S ribosomal protein L6 [Candidatus Spechtbacteria bacterium RIFCSPLOWO2_01_FULL_46_10]
MSRVGKNPISIPDNVQISIEDGKISAKGKNGELWIELGDMFTAKQENKLIIIEPRENTPEIPALWGLYRSLVANVVKGVSDGFEKRLEIEGVGYRVEVKGKELVLHLGFSHTIVMPIPEGLNVSTDKNVIIVTGADRQKVGQFAANIRDKRKPEPYKGKGIHYEGEHIRRKAGKRVAAGVK